jgi:nitrogen fixation NifU-like protein
MSELRELYQEVILDHNRNPRNFREIPGADRRAEGFNPLCGDHLTVSLKLDGDALADVAFQGSGCAISKASASIMTTILKGKSLAQARELFEKFHGMLTTSPGGPARPEGLGKLEVFSGVSEFPVRVKCATLPWHTMRSALENADATVTTE